MIKYLVVDADEQFDDYDDVVNYCLDDEWHRDDYEFKDWVNEGYGNIEIYGTTYTAYEILDAMCEDDLYSLLNEYCEECNDRDAEDAKYELRNGDVGFEYTLHGNTIRIIDTEDEDEDEDEYDEPFDTSATIESLRARLKQNKEEEESYKAEERKADNDLMNMFQIIGG